MDRRRRAWETVLAEGGTVVAPAQPTGLSATPITTARIDLAWTDNATNETAYRVYRSTDGATYAQVGTDQSADTNSYSDTTIEAGTPYWYKVAAVNAGGETLSDAVSTNTLLLGLIAYWKYDEDSGDLLDSVGANNLTDTNTVASDTGKIGTSRLFVAANDEYFTIADNAELSTGDVSFIFDGDIFLVSEPAASIVLAKDQTNREYSLVYAPHGFTFYIFNGGSNKSVAIPNPSPYTGVWKHLSIWHDAGADTINAQLELGTIYSTATAGVYPADANSNFFFGDDLRAADRNLDGKLDEWGFWKGRVFTADERRVRFNAGMSKTYPFSAVTLPSRKIIFDGDSLTSGTGAGAGEDYPSVAVTGLTGENLKVNLGVGSQTLATMVANAAANVDTLYNSSHYAKNIVLVWGGVNDLISGSGTGASVYADLITYCNARSVAGFEVVAYTITPAVTSNESERTIFNNLIKSDHSFCDVFVDLTADARLENYNDVTYFSVDKVHLNAAGYAIVGALAKSAIVSLD